MQHKLREYQEASRLRKRGESYREIALALGVSKNSVSRRCKGLELSTVAQRILESKSNYSKEKFIEYNRRKSEKVQQENQTIERGAIKQLHSLSEYELCLIGSALYWGEGRKTISKSSGPRISFVNSDPSMILI